jgi:hypothetical protein
MSNIVSSHSAAIIGALALFTAITGSTQAQLCPAEGYAGCFLSTPAKLSSAPPATGSLGQPSPNIPPDDREWRTCQRGLLTAGAVVGGTVALKAGSNVVNSAAGKVGSVGQVPVYGKAIRNIPIIGTSAASVHVPTTLGSTPFLGGVVKDIPIVGSTIAGPPNPLLVGAVAVDTYIMPRISPTGYTESSMFTMTDFNSPPRLLHYKNYLAPLTYTHPPVYGPAVPGITFVGRAEAQAALSEAMSPTVEINE